MGCLRMRELYPVPSQELWQRRYVNNNKLGSSKCGVGSYEHCLFNNHYLRFLSTGLKGTTLICIIHQPVSLKQNFFQVTGAIIHSRRSQICFVHQSRSLSSIIPHDLFFLFSVYSIDCIILSNVYRTMLKPFVM
jgi:hypothetical protein